MRLIKNPGLDPVRAAASRRPQRSQERSDGGHRRPGAASEGSSPRRTCSTAGPLAVDPGTSTKVLAGTRFAGLFETVNGGQTWAHVNSTVLPEDVFTLTMDPTSGQVVYAGGVVK